MTPEEAEKSRAAQDKMTELYAAVRNGQHGGWGASPGAYAFWFLGHIVEPSNVRFSDWVAESPDHETINAQVLLVTDDAILLATFAGIQSDNSMGGGYGSAQVISRRAADVRSLTWAVPSMDLERIDQLSVGALTLRFQDDTTIELPLNKANGKSGNYYRQLRTALGM